MHAESIKYAVYAYVYVYAVVCLDCVLISCHTYIMEKCHKNYVHVLCPLTASWNDISVQFASITVILNLIFQKVIEVKVHFVQV